jgi:hypothetical protein
MGMRRILSSSKGEKLVKGNNSYCGYYFYRIWKHESDVQYTLILQMGNCLNIQIN